jgi:hypothetical protein
VTFSVTLYRVAILIMCIGWALFGGLVVHIWHTRDRDH